MKTIREVAEEIGVSKVAVQKKIERLHIRNKMVMDGNRWLVPDEVEDIIIRAFNKSDNDNQTGYNRKENEDVTQTLIAMLQKELEEKNRQIEKLQTIINQEQTLRMVTEQKVIALEQKEQDSKRGLWGRLFGTKPKGNDTSIKDTEPNPNEDDITHEDNTDMG